MRFRDWEGERPITVRWELSEAAGGSAPEGLAQRRPRAVRYVLDANMAIAAMNGGATVRDRLERISAAEVSIPLVAIAELVYGAYRSRRRAENLARVDALRRSVQSLPVTDEVVDRYGMTRADLESRGITKSDFDLIVACTALEEDAVLV